MYYFVGESALNRRLIEAIDNASIPRVFRTEKISYQYPRDDLMVVTISVSKISSDVGEAKAIV